MIAHTKESAKVYRLFFVGAGSNDVIDTDPHMYQYKGRAEAKLKMLTEKETRAYGEWKMFSAKGWDSEVPEHE